MFGVRVSMYVIVNTDCLSICGYRHRLLYMYVPISVIKHISCLSLKIRTVCICENTHRLEYLCVCLA